MTTAAIVLLCLMAPAVFFTVMFENKGQAVKKLIAKSVTSLLFVIAAALCFASSDGAKFRLLMFLALVLCFIGDVVLSLPMESQKRQMLFGGLGMLAFIAGHLLFITAFFPLVDTFKLALLIPLLLIPLLVAVAILTGFLNLGKAPMQIAFLIYSVVIAFTVVSAANAYIYLGGGTLGGLLVSGAALFAVSDILVAIRSYNHKAPKKIIFPIMLVFYYSAQALLTMAVAA